MNRICDNDLMNVEQRYIFYYLSNIDIFGATCRRYARAAFGLTCSYLAMKIKQIKTTQNQNMVPCYILVGVIYVSGRWYAC